MSAIACGDGDQSQLERYNPYPEAPAEEPTTPTIDSLTAAETLKITGMSANVTVVTDNRGMPHIYAANLPDALRAQGFVMARDRFAQMEFIRRAVTGTLTEAISPVAGINATIGDDLNARFFGFKRIGQQVYDTLDATDVVKTSVDAFTEGVNAYVDLILAEKAKGASANLSQFVPRGAGLFNAVLASPFFGRWEPADVMAIARYQTFVLSFAQDDTDRSNALLNIQGGAFPTPQQGVGALLDMAAYAPSREVFTTDAGGPGAVAVAPARTAPSPALTAAGSSGPSFSLNPAGIAAAKQWGDNARRLARYVGTAERGSNNWVVSGAHTKSGAPILANDPHLQLSSPAIWYYTHITATAEGIDAEGVAFAGLPGVVLGFTNDLAWGATVTNFDVVDFYTFNNLAIDPTTRVATVTTSASETINSTPIFETVRTGPATPDQTIAIWTVGNYGQIVYVGGVPQPLGVRTINTDASNELGFFLRLLTSKTIDEARTAQATFFKAGSQNFVMVARSGDIAWQTFSRVPLRPDAATDYTGPGVAAPNTAAGTFCPTFVLPSAPTFTWTGDIEPTELPSLLNPTKGWISTANQDSIGVNRDGNPCNDSVYLGGDYDPGHRDYRIASTLASLVERGNITVEDMQTLQAASKSSLGETIRDPLVAALDRIIHDVATPEADVAVFEDVRDRLFAWSLETPHGYGATDATVIADSVATTLFNVTITRIIAGAFGDEAVRLGVNPPAAQLLERAMNVSAEDTLGMVTFSEALGDTFLWDDIDTGDLESRDDIIATAVLRAHAALTARLGANVDEWTWGRLHTVTFGTLIPPTGLDVQSIPAADDPKFAAGFPRHSDWGAVDVGNYNLWNAYDVQPLPLADPEDDRVKSAIALGDFTYGSGPSQRLVVEMLPTGPVAYNALPGGQSQNPDSKHHADEAALWNANKAPKLNFTAEDVAANAERKILLTP